MVISNIIKILICFYFINYFEFCGLQDKSIVKYKNYKTKLKVPLGYFEKKSLIQKNFNDTIIDAILYQNKVLNTKCENEIYDFIFEQPIINEQPNNFKEELKIQPELYYLGDIFFKNIETSLFLLKDTNSIISLKIISVNIVEQYLSSIIILSEYKHSNYWMLTTHSYTNLNKKEIFITKEEKPSDITVSKEALSEFSKQEIEKFKNNYCSKFIIDSKGHLRFVK